MPRSGVIVPDEIKQFFEAFKLNKNEDTLKYFLIRITDKLDSMEICTKHKKTDNADDDWKAFLADLKEAEAIPECRYAVYDFSTRTASGQLIDKLCFINWIPEDCKPQQKMIYASSKQDLVDKLKGACEAFQATGFDDLDPEEMEKKLSKT